MSFRENLKEELNYQDIKVKELSSKTGIPKGTINHYLAEKSTLPLVDAGVRIAEALNVSVEYLVNGKPKNGKYKNLKESVFRIALEMNNLSEEDLSLLESIVKRLQN